MKRTNLTDQPQEHGNVRDSAAESGRPGEITVFITRREGECAECKKGVFNGAMIRVEEKRVLCLVCADLGHLDYLARGNTALTRRAARYSALHAVVVSWSGTRRRYERQGILATPEAIRRAEEECLADSDVRERNRARATAAREAGEASYVASVTDTIRTQFPGCTKEEAGRIAAWTCRKHSGRVGRSAAAKELDPKALRLAVIAHIRHEHTGYDKLLMETDDRDVARQVVWPEIERLLSLWESPA